MKKIVASFIARDQEFQMAQSLAAAAAAKRLGLEIEVLFAEGNAILQIHQLFQRIHLPEDQKPSAFVVEPVSDEGFERLAKNAVAAGIGWLPLNRTAPYLQTLRVVAPKLPVCNVITDQVAAGRIQGEQIRALLPDGGKVLYVQGPPMTLVEERRRGTEDALAGAEIHRHVVSGTWTEASGEKAVLSWFRLKEGSAATVDLIASQNDHMAVGARRGLLSLRPESARLPVLGIDGLEAGGQRLVQEGRLTATVVMPCNAGRAVEIVAKWLQDGVVPPERVSGELPHSYPAETRLRGRPS